MPSDYGDHWTLESEWHAYDACPRCKAERGQPCRDMKYRHTAARFCWKAHPNRPLVSVLDGYHVLGLITRLATIRDAT